MYARRAFFFCMPLGAERAKQTEKAGGSDKEKGGGSDIRQQMFWWAVGGAKKVSEHIELFDNS